MGEGAEAALVRAEAPERCTLPLPPAAGTEARAAAGVEAGAEAPLVRCLQSCVYTLRRVSGPSSCRRSLWLRGEPQRAHAQASSRSCCACPPGGSASPLPSLPALSCGTSGGDPSTCPEGESEAAAAAVAVLRRLAAAGGAWRAAGGSSATAGTGARALPRLWEAGTAAGAWGGEGEGSRSLVVAGSSSLVGAAADLRPLGGGCSVWGDSLVAATRVAVLLPLWGTVPLGGGGDSSALPGGGGFCSAAAASAPRMRGRGC